MRDNLERNIFAFIQIKAAISELGTINFFAQSFTVEEDNILGLENVTICNSLAHYFQPRSHWFPFNRHFAFMSPTDIHRVCAEEREMKGRHQTSPPGYTQKPFDLAKTRKNWSSGAGHDPWCPGRWTSPRDISVDHRHAIMHTDDEK